MTPEAVQLWRRYAKWWYTVGRASREFQDWAREMEKNPDWSAHDLGDFVDYVEGLRTFGPNPRSLTPGIQPADVIAP